MILRAQNECKSVTWQETADSKDEKWMESMGGKFWQDICMPDMV